MIILRWILTVASLPATGIGKEQNGVTIRKNEDGTRAVFRNSIDSAELLQEETITMPVGGAILTVPVAQAKIMLARIQRYADNAAIVTAGHKIAVFELKAIDKVDAYNLRTGYPEKEAFNV